MTDYIEAAQQALRFIEAQRLEGRAIWRRTDVPDTRGDHSLYHGACGVILLLLELHAATGAPQLLADAVAAGEEVVAYVGDAEPLSVSVAHGWPGYAFTLHELAKAANRPDFSDCARVCLQRLRSQAAALGDGIGWIEPAPFADITGFSDPREIFDQSVGAAGAGLVLLYAHREGLHPDALAWADAVGRRLLEVAEPDADGLRWVMMADMPFPFTAPNFAHGGAGVGYFLAELHRATGEPRFLDAAVQAARYVLSRSTLIGERGRLICHTEEAPEPIFYLGACHGPPGTGRLFLTLHDLTGDAEWLDAAAELVQGLMYLGAPEARSIGLWNNHGQCCGDAGIGEFALLMARRTGESAYLDLATRCAAAILAHSELADQRRFWRQAEHRARPDFVEAQTGYMQGAAGIASFLVHLATSLDSRPVKIALPDWQ